jgi:hypothetical protein
MTRTGPTDVVMPAYSRAADAPVSARTAFRAPGSAWHIPGESTTARPVFPTVASVKPASGRLAGRNGRFRPASQRSRCPRTSEQRFPTPPAYRHKRRTAALHGCSVDPGRDVLCILLSLPRWLQWP